MAVSFSTNAQITIASSDIISQFSIGNSVMIHETEAPANVNIGSPGGGNNWDFSSLQGGVNFITTVVNPSGSPYINEFPGATISSSAVRDIEGDLAQIWFYWNINGGFDNLGSAALLDSSVGSTFITKNTPAARELQLPLTYNSTWSQTYTSTFYLNGAPFINTDLSVSTVVDAYGTMILPGGASFEALRVRESTTSSGITDVYYLFVSKSGAQVSLFASDPNPPLSGAIDLEGYSYNGPFTVTSVEQIDGLPNNYYLGQNFPNPFNPSTKISWQSPVNSHQTLKIYDILGNEVATLVNEYKAAGAYNATFDASGLASGIYLYRLQAGSFVETKKMILLR
jgi:hypothetical protein